MSIQLSAGSLGDGFKYFEKAETQSECENVDDSIEDYTSTDNISEEDTVQTSILRNLNYSKFAFYFTSLIEDVVTPPPQFS